MKVIVSEGTVLYDGTTIHHPGALVDLEDSEATRLIAAGKVHRPDQRISKLELEDADIDEIVTAIGTLSMDDQSFWTSAGKPKVDVLGEILNRDVSGEERDRAWDEFMSRK